MDENDLNHLRDLAEKSSLKRLQDLLEELPDRPQRQDSTGTQLRDLHSVANKLGMYDAADALKNAFFQNDEQ
jgi:hypothetical protein